MSVAIRIVAYAWIGYAMTDVKSLISAVAALVIVELSYVCWGANDA